MSIKNFEQAKQVLLDYVPPARKFRTAYNLDNMRALMAELGNPQEKYRVIHVAGTSGKTSTAYYASSLLIRSGKRVGLTVSPHIAEINDRIQIKNIPLAEDVFCEALGRLLDIVNKLSIKPTYFEVLVAFAYWQFAEQQVDYAVVEVGLGGLLDGTNVIQNPTKVCIITDIGLDHTNVLGTDIKGIAAQKAGIIHEHNNVFAYSQPDGISDVFRDKARSAGAVYHEVGISGGQKELPAFQQRNFNLALNAVKYILADDDLGELTNEQLDLAAQVLVPGRMETIKHGSKTIILDGAHNPQKMKAFMDSFSARYPDKKAVVLLALVAGKDMKLKGVLEELLPHASRIIVTDFQTQQDLRKVAIAPDRVAAFAKEMGYENIEICKKPERALALALSKQDELLVITGSFYLLNHVRPLLLDKHD